MSRAFLIEVLLFDQLLRLANDQFVILFKTFRCTLDCCCCVLISIKGRSTTPQLNLLCSDIVVNGHQLPFLQNDTGFREKESCSNLKSHPWQSYKFSDQSSFNKFFL